MGLAIITVQDLPQHVTHQQLASAIDELHHARRLLLQQLTEQVVEKLGIALMLCGRPFGWQMRQSH